MTRTNETAGRLELVPAGSEYAKELGRICFEAFRSIHDAHSFQRDFPTLEVGEMVIGMFIGRDDVYGVAALLDGKPVGSNFISFTDPVAGVGPITVDPECQARGIGRALMKAVIDRAREGGVERIRLMQDSFNSRSLSLYASLGFDVREPIALMQAAPAGGAHDGVRLAVPGDVPAMDELCVRNYKVSRGNEIANAIKYGFSPFVVERENRIAGYLIPGFLGHGVAETDEDAAALAGEAGRLLPESHAKFFCPLREADLYRAFLANGHRLIKVMTLMTLGPYEPPGEVWMPSVLY